MIDTLLIVCIEVPEGSFQFLLVDTYIEITAFSQSRHHGDNDSDLHRLLAREIGFEAPKATDNLIDQKQLMFRVVVILLRQPRGKEDMVVKVRSFTEG